VVFSVLSGKFYRRIFKPEPRCSSRKLNRAAKMFLRSFLAPPALPQARSTIQSKGRAEVAQLVEQLIRNQQVVGSTPIFGSIFFEYKPFFPALPLRKFNMAWPAFFMRSSVARACAMAGNSWSLPDLAALAAGHFVAR